MNTSRSTTQRVVSRRRTATPNRRSLTTFRTLAVSVAAAVSAAAVFAGSEATAGAQEVVNWQRQLPAPVDSLELKVGTGYTQGFGMILPHVGIPHVAGAGVGVNAEADFRQSPYWSWGIQGQYQELGSQDNRGTRGVVGNIGVTAHGSPYSATDPWARLGAGYRLLWLVDPPNEPTLMIHGFEAANLLLGLDIRPSQSLAIAPVIGGDLNVFVWQNASTLSRAQVGTFVFAGLQVRLDAGPKAVSAPVVANLR
jgi:hypothetical protein